LILSVNEEHNSIQRVDSSLSRIKSNGVVPKQGKPVSTHILCPNGVGLGLPQIESSNIITKRDKLVSTRILFPNGVGSGSSRIISCKRMEKTLIGQLHCPEQIEVLSDEI